MTTDHLDTRVLGWKLARVGTGLLRGVRKKKRRRRRRRRSWKTELKDGNNEDLFSVLVFNEACIGSFRQPIGRESAITFHNNDVFSVCVSQPRASLPLVSIPLVERGKKKKKEKRKRKRVGRESSRIHPEDVRASRAVRVPPFTRRCKLDAFPPPSPPVLVNPLHLNLHQDNYRKSRVKHDPI